MNDDTRDRISATQRARYEQERQRRTDLRNELHAFALWLSPTWDEENEDDVAAALEATDRYLASVAAAERTAEPRG